MKYILLLALLQVSFFSHSQSVKKGTVVSVHFLAPSLKGNMAGENPMRSMTIYLPSGYAGGTNHYPVIYYLHGYSFNDSTCFAWLQVNVLMDAAIAAGIIRPAIVVVPDSYTTFGGSFYTNSAATGNWGDYIGRDVVQYVDGHFRTIPDRNSRGVTGVSMGGNGAIKMGMLFPDIFGAVYVSTLAVLNWSDAINPAIPAFKLISKRNDKEIDESFPARLMIDLARTFSPDTSKAPWYADFPATYSCDSLIINTTVVKRWSASLPMQMLDDHFLAIKSLNAFKMDWGRNDEGQHNLVLCLEFSKKLEHFGVKHFAEEYLGGHADLLPGLQGRFYTSVLPFFQTYLSDRTR